MSTEKILMACVAKGKSRQEMHEVVKVHSVAAGLIVKEQGKDNDLLDRLGNDDNIPFATDELYAMITDTDQFTGRAEAQTDDYIDNFVTPRLNPYKSLLTSEKSDISV